MTSSAVESLTDRHIQANNRLTTRYSSFDPKPTSSQLAQVIGSLKLRADSLARLAYEYSGFYYVD